MARTLDAVIVPGQHLTGAQLIGATPPIGRMLFFQPVLVIWALGATGAWRAYRNGTSPVTPVRAAR